VTESISNRFNGADGLRRIVDIFARLAIASGNDALAEQLARASEIQSYSAGAVITEQGSAENDFFVILSGSVQIERNKRAGPVRTAGSHFGEMSVVDPRATRSATVRAFEDCALARISEPSFAAIANEYPSIWRVVATELAERLRQRLRDVPLKNDRTTVFIGSSREALSIAQAIAKQITGAGRDILVWSDGVFEASSTAIESLEETVRRADVGILVLSPDDKIRSRRKSKRGPRDNVVFELGLFMGAVGRHRSFVVRTTKELKIPSDLLGLTPVQYEDGSDATLEQRLSSVCNELNKQIERLGPK
jgi:CRP/FNR family transcriptional regulator, cyclic AMP receptor protein